MTIGDWIADWRFDCRLSIADWIDDCWFPLPLPNRQSPISSPIPNPIDNPLNNPQSPNPIATRQSSIQSPIGNPLLNPQSSIDDSIANLHSAVGNQPFSSATVTPPPPWLSGAGPKFATNGWTRRNSAIERRSCPVP